LFRIVPVLFAAIQGTAHAAAYLESELNAVSSTAAAGQGFSMWGELLQVGLSLVFVVGLVYVAYWLMLKWRNRQGAPTGPEKVGLIKVLEKHHIDGQHALAAVEIGDEVVFLGLGQDVTVLSRVSDPEAVERLRQMAPLPADFLGFKEQLARVGLRMKREEWGQAKEAMRTQAEELKEQMERLRSRRGEGK
jgi:flagellar protein FliO/FliZ